MDELEKLFNVLSRDGYYTKSFEEFQAKYNDPAYRDKVFSVVTRDGLFTKTREEFDAKYAPSGVETVEVETEVQEGPLKKKEGTVSPSGLGSLGLPSVTDIIEGKAAGPQETVEVETEVEVEAPQAPPSSDGEIKQSFLDRVGEKAQRSIDKKEEYQTYNPAVAPKSATADFTQYKDYLPAGVKEIPNAKQVLEGDYNPVVPFDQAEYEKNREAYQIIYNNKVKDYEEYLKGKAEYIKGYDGKYYSSDKFSPETILRKELATLQSRDGNLMDLGEEAIADRMSERLGKFGFDVKYDPSVIDIPSGRIGSAITITSQHTGKKIDINTDKINFIDLMRGDADREDAQEIDKLNAFVLKNFDEDKVEVKDLLKGLSAQDKASMGAETERKYETLSVGRTISDAEDMVVGIDKQIEAANKMLEEAQAMPDYEEAVSTSVGSGMLMGTSLRGVNKKKALKLKQANAQLEYLKQQKKDADALLKSAEEGKQVQATKFISKVLGDQMMTESERLENEGKELSYISKVFTEVNNRLISNTERIEKLTKESYDEESKSWKSEEALQEAKDLIVEIAPDLKNRNELARIANEKQNDYRLDAENLRKDVGRKVILDAQVGGLTGSIVRSLVSGAGGVAEGVVETFFGDLYANINNMFYDENEEGYLTDAERKKIKEDSIQDDLVGYVSDKFGITDEAMEAYRYGLSLQDMINNVKEGKEALEGSNWLTEGIYGTIESLPAISTGLIGGASLMLPSFAAMGINGINKEMKNNPMFANIPENEKLLLTLPYGVVIGVLETVGFRNVINNSSFVTNLLLKSIKKFKGSTNRTFRETVIDVVQNKIQKGLILTAASGAAEFETGAAQKLAEGYMKEAYDVAKGMDYFKQSIDFLDGKYITKDFVDLIFHAGLAEMVGGISLGAVSAISQARKNNTIPEIPIAAFMAYEKAMLDPSIRMAQMLKINSQVEQGLKTKEQAAKEVQDYDITIGQLRAIPQEFDLKSKQQILALESQKKILEDQIEGKSVFTTREQQRQIKVLEERIEEVSANAQKGEAKKSNQDILTEEFVKSATKEEVVPEETVENISVVEEALDDGSLKAPVYNKNGKKLLFTGSPRKFESFDMSKVGSSADAGQAQGIFFSNDPYIAEYYSKETMDPLGNLLTSVGLGKLKGIQPTIYSATLDTDNIVEVDFEGEATSEGKDKNKIIQEAFENGYDAVVLKNIYDGPQVKQDVTVVKDAKFISDFTDTNSKAKAITKQLKNKKSTPPIAEEVDEEVTQEQLDEVRALEEETPVAETVVEEEVTTEEARVTEEEQEPKTETAGMRLFKNEEKLRRDKELRIREAEQRAERIKKIKELEKSKRKGPRKILKAKVPEVTQEQEDSYNNNEMSQEEIKDILRGVYAKRQTRSDEAFAKVKEKDMSPELTVFERNVLKENSDLYSDIVATEPISTLFDRFTGKPKTETKVETPKKKAPVKETPKKEAPKKETGVDAKLRAIAVKMDKAAKEKVSSKVTKAERELIKKNTKRFKEINDEVKMPTTTADGLRSAIKMVEDSFKEKEAKIKEQIKTIDDRVTDRMTKDKDRRKKKDELSKARKEKNAKVKELKGKLKDMGAKFRLSDDVATESPEGFITEDAIVEVMKGLGSAEANFKIPPAAKEKNVDPIAQSKSTKKITDAQAKKLGFKSVADMLKNIQEFNDIPMIVAMSDVLASGVVKDSMGNDMQVDGGLLYNVLGRNKELAWAGVNKDGANTQFTEAQETYRANKELFDRLWKEGKLPNNHIPMVVVRMDNAAINSNEAMFRFMAPKLKSFPKEVQKIAFDTFLEQLESKKKSKSEEPLLIEGFIEKNNIKDLGTLFDLIVEDAKKRAQGDTETFSLTTKSYLLDMIASPVGVKKASKPVAKAIMNATDYNGEIFLIDNILSEIGEPSMVEGERGDAVAIMGVDISKDGGVKKANHNNYGFGPKGRLIALIKNPTNVLEIFPEWRTKAFKMFEVKPSTGKMKTDAQVLADVYGQVFGDKAFRGSRVTEEMSDIDMVSAQMRFAFPSVSVSQTQQEFDEALKQEGIRTAESNGNTILGLTKDGKIFLNPSRKSLSTPIHEFGHIWIDFLRSESSKTKGTKLLKRGLELVEGTKALESAIKKYGDNELAREEALVELMGTKGETIANAAKRAKFIEWFNAFFKYIKEKLTRFKDVKVKDIKNISLEDFVDIGLAELFSGEAVDTSFKPEKADTSAKARMQIIGENAQLSQQVRENLSVAKEMQALGTNSKLQIFLSTGWQQGKDSMWRYEIPDGEINKEEIYDLYLGTFNNVMGSQTVKITDILEAPELYKAYPSLKNIPVVFTEDKYMDGADGSYSPGGFNMIRLNENLLRNEDQSIADVFELKSILLHEVQHAIQHEEGFATGGNLGTGRQLLNTRFAEQTRYKEHLRDIIKRIRDLNTIEVRKIEDVLAQNPDIEVYEFEKIAEQLITNAKASKKYIKPRAIKIKKLLEELNDMNIEVGSNMSEDIANTINSIYKEINNIKSPSSAYEAYKRIAGEVEARNVQARMNLSEEERREISLEETEKVPREQQLLLFNRGPATKPMASMKEKGVDLKGDMQTMINKAREEGFKDSEIKDVLKAIGYKARNINEALRIEIETDVTMPSIFGDIEGGAVKGQEMFTRLREKVAKFAKKNSPAKTREKAMELLREDPTYKEQSEKTKLELIKEFDKTLKSKANAKVRQEIAGIKQRIKDVTTGEVSIKDARTRLKNLIKDTLPKSREYSQADINRLNKIVDDTTPKNYQAQVTKFFKQFNEIRGKQRKSKLKKILKDIQAKAKQSKKSGARIAAEDQPFFKQAAVLVKAAMDGDAEVFAELADEMTEKEAEIFELFEKINNKEELTVKERELVAKAQAFDMLGKINNQELEALDDVIAAVKAETKASRERLKGKRLARKEIYDRLKREAKEEIRAGYPYLFDEVIDEQGNKTYVELTPEEIDARRQEVRAELLKAKNLTENVRKYFGLAFASKGKSGPLSFVANYIKHLGTLMNGLDRKGNFFTENIYKRLNRMEEKNLSGYFATVDAIDNNINTIDGIDKGLDGLYEMLNDSLFGKPITQKEKNKTQYELKNVVLGDGNRSNTTVNKDEAARIIAMSRNEDVRKRLREQGIGDAEIKKLEKFIGEPAVKAVDKIVDYLSSTYYESINKVYEDVNDVSLGYVENYFPVKSLSKKTDAERSAELATALQEGKFTTVFSAQQASALKERTSKDAVILIKSGLSFTGELDNHLKEMERFKAYAQGTKEINVIVNHTPSVKNLLNATSLSKIVKKGVGYAINPRAAEDLYTLNNPWFSKLQEKFTGVALALKSMQLPKQASSFVNAFADYKFKGKGITGRGRIPIVDTAVDLLTFIGEAAYIFALESPYRRLTGQKTAYQEAKEISGTFRNRMRQSFKTADISGLEGGSGMGSRSMRARSSRASRLGRKAKIGANSATLLGDAAGVMGYMVAYRNNIRNGMSPEEALERFNDYNATQQTRRATERNALQYNPNAFTRMFTMFGSTLMLQINKVMQSATNIRRNTAEGVNFKNDLSNKERYQKLTSSKDYRELYLNLGLANLAFTVISNIFKYNPFMGTGDDGDDDEDTLKQRALDRQQVLEEYAEALSGLKLLYNLPLIGGGAETLVDTYWWGYSDAIRDPKSRLTDPISNLIKTTSYEFLLDKSATPTEEKIGKAVAKTLFNYSLGIPSTPILAGKDLLQDWFTDNEPELRAEYEELDEDGKRIAKEESFEQFKENRYEEHMYELFGVSYSYRPGSAKSKDIIYVPIEVNKKSKDDDDSSSKPSRPQRPQRPQRPRRN